MELDKDLIIRDLGQRSFLVELQGLEVLAIKAIDGPCLGCLWDGN